jgi:hypothetical protein
MGVRKDVLEVAVIAAVNNLRSMLKPAVKRADAFRHDSLTQALWGALAVADELDHALQLTRKVKP